MSHSIPRKPVASASYTYMGVGEQAVPLQQITAQPTVTIHSHQQASTPQNQAASDYLLHGAATQVASSDDVPKEATISTSEWKVDWQTSAILIGSYLAAFGAAVGHLIFFLKLNGTHVKEYHINQGNVTTISIIISAIWGISLSICVSTIFTQSLWNLFRQRYTTVADIDKLYGLLGNVFLIRPRLMWSMPILYLLAILSWSLSIVRALPPGALTVDTVPYYNATNVVIPTFNSSYVGNGSIMDIALYVPGSPSYIYTSDGMRLVLTSTPSNNLQKRLSYYFTIGELQPAPSPCGSNCSFALEFEGPYLNCTKTIVNTTIDTLEDLIAGQNNQLMYQFYKSDYNSTVFNLQTYKPLHVPVTMTNNTFVVQTDQTLAEVNNTQCQYATAMYATNITYTGGIRTVTHSAKPLAPLNFTAKCPERIRAGGINFNSISCGDLGNHKGPDGNILFSDAGYKAICGLKTYLTTEYLLKRLVGSMPLTCSLADEVKQGLNDIGCKLGAVNETSAPILNTFFWSDQVSEFGSNSNVPQFAGDIPILHTDVDVLNAALFNVTMTYMYSEYNFLNTTAVATMDWQILTYLFSRPLNLVLPYFIPLLLSVMALSYAFVLLYRNNHVAAMGDSFIQILMTTTGTETITSIAAGGCLGGGNNVPKELEKLKIKYGDITETVGSSDSLVRRAGFGIEGEVQPLRRRAVYGFRSMD